MRAPYRDKWRELIDWGWVVQKIVHGVEIGAARE